MRATAGEWIYVRWGCKEREEEAESVAAGPVELNLKITTVTAGETNQMGCVQPGLQNLPNVSVSDTLTSNTRDRSHICVSLHEARTSK